MTAQEDIPMEQMSALNSRTRAHYDSLIPRLERGYVDYRWRGHPLKEVHYAQTERALSRALDSYVPRAERMLEIGCGPGTWSEHCLKHCGHLTLLDISREMLSEANLRYGDNNGVSLVCGDFSSGVLGTTATFDAIVSVRALEYITPKKAFARQVVELLGPDGTLVVITKNPGWRDADGKSGFGGDSSGGIHTDWIAWRGLSRLLTGAGMRVLAVRPVTFGSYLSPFDNAVGRATCNLLHRFAERRPMSRKWDRLTESYLVVAQRQGSGR